LRLHKVNCNISEDLVYLFWDFQQVNWFKNGKPLKTNERYDIVYSLGICSLEISACDPSDAGQYTCIAENEKGTTETSSKVTVNGKNETLCSSVTFN